MKQVFKYASLLFVAGALLVTSCSKKKDDDAVKPVETPPPATGSDICLGNNTVKVLIDASTNASQDSYNNKSYACTAVTGSAVTLFLDIKSKKDLDYIFIKKETSSGVKKNFTGTASIKSEANQDLIGGSDFSYKIPDGDFITSALQVKIPLDQITANETDIYTVWFTRSAQVLGEKGSFDNVNSKLIVGPITVILKNGSAVGLFSTATPLTLGDQGKTGIASYVTTKGGVNTLLGASLFADDVTAEEKITSLNGADINFVSIAADGSELGNGSTGYFISVGDRGNLKFTTNTEGTTFTKFAKVTTLSTKAFADVTASDISALPTPTENKVKVETNSQYVFVTSDGRKGVIYTSNLTSPSPRTVDVQVKVYATL
jgi:hypothetical protein